MPLKQTIYYRDGSSADLDAIDARRALAEHPEEWATTPWPEGDHAPFKKAKAEQEAAQQTKQENANLPATQSRSNDSSAEMVPLAEVQQLVDDAVKTAVAAALAQSSAPANPGDIDTPDFKAPYEARDKGRGWWAIFDSTGAEVGKSIREDEGAAFNAKSDDEKAAFVKAHAAIS